jgi:isocitrate dehydrogenase (NAD+)
MTPVGGGFRSVNVALRQGLDLYANLRPVRSYRGIPSPFEDVDLIIVRENTEDLYIGIEHQVSDLAGVGFKLTTRFGSERIGTFAFDYAMQHGRKQVTAVHKANVLPIGDGLFLRSVRRVAGRYPKIEYQERLVDNLAAEMIRRPRNFDVLVLPNLYGDIYSDLCAGLVGGLGVAPGANIGQHGAVFEAVHGTAPDIAGKNLANPTATILSGVMMLEHLGEFEAAQRIRIAVESVLGEGYAVTGDLGGTAGTIEMADAVVQRLDAGGDKLAGGDESNRVFDILRLAALAQHDGPFWSQTTGDFNINAVRFDHGRGVASHVNPEVDVLITVLEGEGFVEIAGEHYPLHAGQVVFIPRGVRRRISSSEGNFVYLSAHKKRAGLLPS